tara:strand:- start:14760 stop:15845 length:1086 start_codon:yes stop_codon:yes gene_type:complete
MCLIKILHITSSFMPPKENGDLNYSQRSNDDEGFYTGARVGGVSSVVDSMSSNLDIFEHHVLLSQGQNFNYGFWTGRKNIEIRDKLHIHYFPNSGDISKCKDVEYTFKGILEKEYEDFSFDVIITHVVQPNMDLTGIDKKCKWINFTHGSPTNSNLSDIYMDMIDVNLLFSDWQKTKLKDNSKTTVIPFPVDTSVFYPRTDNPQNDFVWHGRIAPEKRIIDFAVEFENSINSNLFVVGGPDNINWKEDIENSHLQKTHFLGRQFDEVLAQTLSNHKYYVLMSEYETYCVGLLEALSAGCSVYAVYHPSLEWAKDLVCFVDTIDDLFEAIKNPTTNNNFQWVMDNMSWSKLRTDYENLIALH